MKEKLKYALQLTGSIHVIKKVEFKDLEVDENYLVFVGLERTPSGFDIGNFCLNGNFDLQTKSEQIGAMSVLVIYTLPKY